MKNFELISSINDSAEVLLTESNGGKTKNYYLKGITLQGNIKNQNGRTYPTSVLEEAVESYNQEFLSKRRAYGEWTHPSSPAINLERVSHVFEELYKDGDNFIGKAKIMNTPLGKIAKVFIDEGCQLALSSRGLGAVSSDIVQRGFRLTTAGDIVHDPSAPHAFVQNLLEGNKILWEESSLLEEDVASVYNQIKKAKQRDIEAVILEQFNAFISKIH